MSTPPREPLPRLGMRALVVFVTPDGQVPIMQSGELLGYATMRADGHLYLQADHDRCCELHGRNCGPLSELCCGECTEASHDAIGFRTGVHEDGTLCSRPNLSANTVEEAGRREMADKVSRIRAHLEYLLGVADGATRPPWKVAGLTGVIADNGIDQGLVDATWSSLGVSADRNTVSQGETIAEALRNVADAITEAAVEFAVATPGGACELCSAGDHAACSAAREDTYCCCPVPFPGPVAATPTEPAAPKDLLTALQDSLDRARRPAEQDGQR